MIILMRVKKLVNHQREEKAPNFQGYFLAVPITSQSGYENSLVLQQDDFMLGVLPKISYVRPDKLITLNESLVIQRIGRLSKIAFTRIHAAGLTVEATTILAISAAKTLVHAQE